MAAKEAAGGAGGMRSNDCLVNDSLALYPVCHHQRGIYCHTRMKVDNTVLDRYFFTAPRVVSATRCRGYIASVYTQRQGRTYCHIARHACHYIFFGDQCTPNHHKGIGECPINRRELREEYQL